MSDDPYALACRLLAAVAGDAESVRLAARLVARLRPCRHGPDFACVLWHGKTYSFTAAQAAAVKVLWAAWEQGTPDLRQAYVLEAVGAESERLSDLFRQNEAWGQLIVPGPVKGTFRLAEGQAAAHE